MNRSDCVHQTRKWQSNDIQIRRNRRQESGCYNRWQTQHCHNLHNWLPNSETIILIMHYVLQLKKTNKWRMEESAIRRKSKRYLLIIIDAVLCSDADVITAWRIVYFYRLSCFAQFSQLNTKIFRNFQRTRNAWGFFFIWRMRHSALHTIDICICAYINLWKFSWFSFASHEKPFVVLSLDATRRTILLND